MNVVLIIILIAVVVLAAFPARNTLKVRAVVAVAAEN